MARASLALVVCAAAGCAPVVQSRTIARTVPPPPKTAPSNLPAVTPGRVLVLSPLSIGQVSGTLTAETAAAPSTAGATAQGVLQTTDYNMAVSAAESALLEGGWRPISQAVLAKAAGDDQVKQSLRGHTLLEQAIILGKAVQAEHVLILRALTFGVGTSVVGAFRPSDACSWRAIAPFSIDSDAALLDREGEVLWTGRGRSQATDLLPSEQATYTYRYDPGKNSCSWDWGSTLSGELLAAFCEAWWKENYGDPKAACASMVPSREVIKLLIEANIPQVVSALNRATQHAAR